MTSGTKLFLAVFAGFVGVLILYYGFLMPSGDVVQVAGNVMTDGDTSPRLISAETPKWESAKPQAGDGFLSEAVQETFEDEESAVTEEVVEAVDPWAMLPLMNVSPTVENEREPVGVENVPRPTGIGADRMVPTRSVGPPARLHEYVVKSGDTMTSIAAEWFGDERQWSLIAKANPWVDPSRMQIGQKLQLPERETKIDRGKEKAKETSTKVEQGIYVVRAGDTLAKIARDHYGGERRWKEIYEANRAVIGDDPAVLSVGMKLVVLKVNKPQR